MGLLTREKKASEETGQKWPALAAFLSAFVPGAGQLYGGRWRRAIVIFVPFLALFLAGAAILVSLGTIDLVGLLVQPRVLWTILAINTLLLGWRLFAVADAYFGTPSAGVFTGVRSSLWGGALLLALVIAVAAPHVVVTQYGLDAIGLIEEVFAEPEVPAAAYTVPADRAEDLLAGPAEEEQIVVGPKSYTSVARTFYINGRPVEGHLIPDGPENPVVLTQTIPTANDPSLEVPLLPLEERLAEQRLTFLLAGGDAGPGRSGLRTDTMMVMTVDILTGDASLFGIPRNFRNVPLPHRFRNSFLDLERRMFEEEVLNAPDFNLDGFPDTWEDLDGDLVPDEPLFEPCGCYPEILNSLHGRTRGWTSTYPDSVDPGMEALKEVLEHLLELRIDYYVLVDMAAFVDLIDAFGGVEVMVTNPLHVTVSPAEEGAPKASVNVEPGMNRLSGSEALAYVRWRRGSSDYVRMIRQRCLVGAVAAQADPLTVLRTFPAIADVIRADVVTNIPRNFLPGLVDITGKINFDALTTVGLVPPRFSAGRVQGYPVPNVSRMRSTVSDVIAGVYESPPRATGDDECGL